MKKNTIADAQPLLDTRVVRIWNDLRTYHYETLLEMKPSCVVYFRESYDFQEPEGRAVMTFQAGLWATMLFLIRSRAAVIEINEPLAVGLWPKLVAYCALLRFRRTILRRETSVVTYCIENTDIAKSLTSKFGLGLPISRMVIRLVGGYVFHTVDKAAFGTRSALEEYNKYFPVHGNDQMRLMPELPNACRCGEIRKDSGYVIFVGTFDARKGVLPLLEAWPLVVEERSDAQLSIIGQGPLETEVIRLACDMARVEVVVDPPREEIHRAFLRASVGVLLSQPNDRWREQLGLPIFEAVAHGAEVVATEESGFADWLKQNGHAVLSPLATSEDIAKALCAILESPRPPAEIIAQLPDVHGRIAADRWLVS